MTAQVMWKILTRGLTFQLAQQTLISSIANQSVFSKCSSFQISHLIITVEFTPFWGYLKLDHPVICKNTKRYSHIQIITWIKSYNFFKTCFLWLWSRNRKWYGRERNKSLETFYVKWNFVVNVNYNGNENICEAIITITFPCQQTIMKHYVNEFNLTQFECWIQNLINLLVNRKKLDVFFLLLSLLISEINSATTSCDFFDDMYFFIYF